MQYRMVLLDRALTLHEDSSRAWHAIFTRGAPPVDARVYFLVDRAYGRPG